MFKWVAGRLRCLQGKHHRSAKHAYKVGEGEQYSSICVYCHVPMRRRAKRDWVVAER